jgi:hypothetical protein
MEQKSFKLTSKTLFLYKKETGVRIKKSNDPTTVFTQTIATGTDIWRKPGQ